MSAGGSHHEWLRTTTDAMPLLTTSSSSNRTRSKKRDPLNMKIPHNPKYAHIKSGLDTGASMSKYMSKIEEIRKNYRYRKNEIFKRMKMSTFVQLVIKVAEYNNSLLDDDNPDEPSVTPTNQVVSTSCDQGDDEAARDTNPSPSISLALTDGDFGEESIINTARSTLESVSRGIGEMDLDTPQPDRIEPPNSPGCPYLLLDIRDIDCYTQCHIISAINFPIAMLSRSMNGEIKDLLRYKNQPGKIILIYDDDERLAVRAATTLAERGYDNVFLLSGGLKLASRYFTDGFITGTLPSSITGERPTRVTPATKTHFSPDDIEKLQLLLDNALQDNSIGESNKIDKVPDVLDKVPCNSRLSKASTTSSRLSNASTSSSSHHDFAPLRPPFKP